MYVRFTGNDLVVIASSNVVKISVHLADQRTTGVPLCGLFHVYVCMQ